LDRKRFGDVVAAEVGPYFAAHAEARATAAGMVTIAAARARRYGGDQRDRSKKQERTTAQTRAARLQGIREAIHRSASGRG